MLQNLISNIWMSRKCCTVKIYIILLYKCQAFAGAKKCRYDRAIIISTTDWYATVE